MHRLSIYVYKENILSETNNIIPHYYRSISMGVAKIWIRGGQKHKAISVKFVIQIIYR
jgi:hypothetical protein